MKAGWRNGALITPVPNTSLLVCGSRLAQNINGEG